MVGNANIARNVYRYKNEGLYAQATYDLSEHFAVTGGLRHTWDWQDVRADNIVVRPIHSDLPGGGTLTYNCTRAVTPANPDSRLTQGGFCTRTFSKQSSAPTWLINLDYTPNNNLHFYAKYSRGYRGGGINESNIGAETWDPEKLEAYEIGFKSSFRGSVSGNFNIAGFWNEFKNQQATVSIPACILGQTPGCVKPASVGINGIQNVGASRIRGIEADAALTFFDSLRFDLAYSYLDAIVTEIRPAVCDSTSYNCSLANFLNKVGGTLPYTPKNTFTATATYTFPMDKSMGTLSVGATFSHTDSQFVGSGNAAEFAAGRIPFDTGIIPARNLVNVNVNWKDVGGKPIDLALFVTNLTKEEGYVAGGASGLGTIGAEYITLGQPQMFGFRVRYRFGD